MWVHPWGSSATIQPLVQHPALGRSGYSWRWCCNRIDGDHHWLHGLRGTGCGRNIVNVETRNHLAYIDHGMYIVHVYIYGICICYTNIYICICILLLLLLLYGTNPKTHHLQYQCSIAQNKQFYGAPWGECKLLGPRSPRCWTISKFTIHDMFGANKGFPKKTHTFFHRRPSRVACGVLLNSCANATFVAKRMSTFPQALIRARGTSLGGGCSSFLGMLAWVSYRLW